jgi:hypothetical protein
VGRATDSPALAIVLALFLIYSSVVVLLGGCVVFAGCVAGDATAATIVATIVATAGNIPINIPTRSPHRRRLSNTEVGAFYA